MGANINTVAITYNSVLAIPYNNNNPQDQFVVSPDLSTQFSSTRSFNGVLSAVCDTVPIGNTGLNGYFASAALADTRDVAQNLQASGQYNAYAISDLVQAAITRKDGFKESSVMRGVVLLPGSDIQPFYTNPYADSTDRIEGDFTSYPLINFPTSTAPVAGISALGSIVLVDWWISPWAISMGPPKEARVVSTTSRRMPSMSVVFSTVSSTSLWPTRVRQLLQRSFATFAVT